MIILTIGIEGSGKSYWSKEFVKNNPEWKFESTDKIYSDYISKKINEDEYIRKLNKNMYTIINHIINNKNVVIDLTVCNLSIIDSLLRVFLNHTKEIEFKIFYCDPNLAYKIIESDITNGTDRPNFSISDLEKQYKNYKEVVKYLKENNYTIRMF